MKLSIFTENKHTMILFPNCKINIGLDVIRRRPDGYHDIETVMYPVHGICDSLEIIRGTGAEAELTTSGLPADCGPEDNLVMKAYRLMQVEYGIGRVKMHLHKNIPTGAGLGGGSSDAAFAIKALDSIFGLGLSPEEMESLCARLGSDVPFFIRNTPRFCSGRGEIMTPAAVNLAGKYLAVVKPDIHISTAEAYAGITPSAPDAGLGESVAAAVEKWPGLIENAFEKTVFDKYPQIGLLKKSLYSCGAVYSSMTGSGSAVYGIFNKKPSCISTIYENVFISEL